MSDQPTIVKCAHCGEDRWWVSASVSPAFCFECMKSLCWCGHFDDAHAEAQEVDLDGRPVGSVYDFCDDCVTEDRVRSNHAYATTEGHDR